MNVQLPSQYTTDNGEVNAFGAFMFILTAAAMIYFIASTHVQLKNNMKSDDDRQKQIDNLKIRVKALEDNNKL